MIWLNGGACASAIVSYSFVWTKYPAPLTKAFAKDGFTRIPIPRAMLDAPITVGSTRAQG